ncbi:MAG TPA: hypothetical protein VKB86_09680 [Pyrinomonadaceae bacterium]|nr:hypothetical protein [Pyrinomonadaceae bacterium]
MQPEEARRLEQQVRVSKTLADGFMFSIVWLGGIGSLVALIKGLRALRIIQRSNGELTGKGMAWWCIIAGALGSIIAPLLFFLSLTRNPQ